MSPRTCTASPDDKRLWRRVLVLAHPDRGGDSEAFIWLQNVRESLCTCEVTGAALYSSRRREGSTWRPTHGDNKERIPYPAGADFEAGTREALRVSDDLGTFQTYGGLLALLANCEPLEYYARQQERGASYKQLAAIAHTAGMSKVERAGWYRLAESIPLSDRHAGHILGRLKANKKAAA